jgi:hypothetical protein
MLTPVLPKPTAIPVQDSHWHNPDARFNASPDYLRAVLRGAAALGELRRSDTRRDRDTNPDEKQDQESTLNQYRFNSWAHSVIQLRKKVREVMYP